MCIRDRDYTALENELRQKIANIERTHPGYDEYRYQVDELGHNPYELTSYLIAKLRTYTRENVQGELRALFEAQYKLTLTEEVEIRYRTETDTWTEDVYKRQVCGYAQQAGQVQQNGLPGHGQAHHRGVQKTAPRGDPDGLLGGDRTLAGGGRSTGAALHQRPVGGRGQRSGQ